MILEKVDEFAYKVLNEKMDKGDIVKEIYAIIFDAQKQLMNRVALTQEQLIELGREIK